MNERKHDSPGESINPDDPAQLHYWLTSLAVTEAQLKAALQAVGSEPGKVREYLAKTVARP